MKKLTTTAFAFILLFSLHAQRISIQPSVLDFRVGAGTSQVQTVRISNMSDKKLSFQAYLADWLRDSVGGHQYFKPDTLKRSCASWVSLDKNFVEVAPGASEEFIVKLTAPADQKQLEQMKWAMLFIQSADEKESGSAKKQMETQVKELLRVGVHVYETPPGLFNRSVKAVAFSPAKEKNTYELSLKNTGDLMLQCKTYLELTDPATGKTYKTDKIEFPVFPEGVRKIKMPLPADVPKGKYSALAIIDVGDDAPLEGIEKTIEVL